MTDVSIITPLYNKEAYLRATWESVCQQNLTRWEWIIIENGSTDKSAEVATAIASRDERVHLVDMGRQAGPSAARNEGLRHAKGKWVLFLDADDALEGDFLTSLITRGEASDGSIVAGGWRTVAADGYTEISRERPCCEECPAELRAFSLSFTPWIVHAAIVRRDLMSEHGIWPEEMCATACEDHVFWYRLLAAGARVAFDSSQGALYRRELADSRHPVDDTRRWFAAALEGIELNLRTRKALPEGLSWNEAKYLGLFFEGALRKASRQGDVTLLLEVLASARKVLRGALRPFSLRHLYWELRLAVSLRVGRYK